MAVKKSDANEPQEQVQFDPKWLKGLEFSTTELRKSKGDGSKTEEKRVPVIRPLTEEEVLSWKIYGDEVAIVAADGRKYRVKR